MSRLILLLGVAIIWSSAFDIADAAPLPAAKLDPVMKALFDEILDPVYKFLDLIMGRRINKALEEKIFAMADSNKDMHVDLAEFLEFNLKLLPYLVNKLVALMPVEMGAEVVKGWPRYLVKAYITCQHEFDQMDKDGDGKLSKAEAMEVVDFVGN